MSTTDNPNPSSSHPSSSVPTSSNVSRGKAPKGKMKVTIQPDGSVVGEFHEVWSTRTGDLVRANFPISYEDIRDVPKEFKNDVWNCLMDEFELVVPHAVARPLVEMQWSQKFRTHKNTLRRLLKNNDPSEVEPKGINPDVWKKFLENESNPKKKMQLLINSNNRKNWHFHIVLGVLAMLRSNTY